MKDGTLKNITASDLLRQNVKRIIGENNKRATGCQSLAQLAQAMDISAPSLTHALKGNPSLSTIQKMADALNVSIASLFYDRKGIEGFISVEGKIAHFISEEELYKALGFKQEKPEYIN